MGNDNWIEFIYILLFAAIGIVSRVVTFKGKQKSNKKYTHVPETEEKQDVLFGDDAVNEEFTDPEMKPEKISTPIFDALLEENNKIENRVKDKPVEPIGRVAENISCVENIKSKVILHEEIEEDESDFDLREAVVYSEIINRKYT